MGGELEVGGRRRSIRDDSQIGLAESLGDGRERLQEKL